MDTNVTANVTGLIPRSRMQGGHGVFAGLAYGMSGTVVGLSLLPAVGLVAVWWESSAAWSAGLRLAGLGLMLGWGYCLFGVTLLGVTAAVCRLARLPVRPGDYPFFSVAAARWAFGYVLTLTVQTLFLPFLRSTPLICAWYRGMGATIGPDVQINTTQLNDAPLLAFDQGALIGADALLICHATEEGNLLLRTTQLGAGAAIGAGAVLMPGVTLGAEAVVLPGSVVPANTQIPAGDVWAGVPARCVKSGAERAQAA